MSKQGISKSVSHDHIVDSRIELIQVMRFLKLTNDQVMVWIFLQFFMVMFSRISAISVGYLSDLFRLWNLSSVAMYAGIFNENIFTNYEEPTTNMELTFRLG